MSQNTSVHRVGALALALAGGLLAAPSVAEPLPPELDPVVCALPADALSDQLGRASDVDTDVVGDAAWDLVDTRGKDKPKDVVGSMVTDWEVEGPRCAGLTYRFTVIGSAPLGWTTTAASTTSADGAPSTVVGTTTPSSDGRSVSVSFVAQQDTQGFVVTGTTARYAPEDGCVDISLTVTGPDGREQYRSDAELCDDLSGSTSYR